MKRYWKVLLLAGIIVAGFGALYGNRAINAEGLPQLVLEEKEGTSEAVADLIIDGTLFQRNIYDRFKYVDGETKTSADFSYFEDLDGKFYAEEDVLRYQEEYRSFMRGKTPESSYFSENDTYVIYAEAPFTNLTEERFLTIERLNKETGDTTEWTVPSPAENPYDYFVVQDVYMDEGVVKLMINQTAYEEDAVQDDYIVYEFDLETEELTQIGDIAAPLDLPDNLTTYHMFISDMKATSNQRFVPFQTMIVDQHSGESESEDESTAFYVYDFVTHNITTVTPEIRDASTTQTAFKNDWLYFYTVDSGTVELQAYNMADETFSEPQTLDLGEYASSFVQGNVMTIDDQNRLFLMSQLHTSETEAHLLAFDLSTGERIYAGEASLEDPPEGQYELYFNPLFFR